MSFHAPVRVSFTSFNLTNLKSNISYGLIAAQWLALALIVSGCSKHRESLSRKPVVPKSGIATRYYRPVNLVKDQPNELGRVPILEYHNIGPKESRWIRTPDHFRGDLERLYKLGYRPISLYDFVQGRIDLPPGLSPVIFTFDDSAPGQFRYLGSGPAATLDPNCAVGIMQAFHKKHPDFALKATFFVLPRLFDQRKFRERKLRELRSWGFDIGNHTYTHRSLRKISKADGILEVERGAKFIDGILPNYPVRAIALPEGGTPRDASLLPDGRAEGFAYHNDAALLGGADPAPSPFSVRYNPMRLPRVQGTDKAQPAINYWLDHLEANRDRKYRSDGDPRIVTFPKSLKPYLNPKAVKGLKIRMY